MCTYVGATMKIIIFLCIIFGVSSCEHVKPYQREFLTLDIMQDSVFPTSLIDTTHQTFEKLNCSGFGSVVANCPTCGG